MSFISEIRQISKEKQLKDCIEAERVFERFKPKLFQLIKKAANKGLNFVSFDSYPCSRSLYSLFDSELRKFATENFFTFKESKTVYSESTICW